MFSFIKNNLCLGLEPAGSAEDSDHAAAQGEAGEAEGAEGRRQELRLHSPRVDGGVQRRIQPGMKLFYHDN